eukprot:4822647-Pyramimonas_sp.AAC.1
MSETKRSRRRRSGSPLALPEGPSSVRSAPPAASRRGGGASGYTKRGRNTECPLVVVTMGASPRPCRLFSAITSFDHFCAYL